MQSHDVFTPEQRSAVMRAVKSAGTTPERSVRAIVRELGYGRRYRLNARTVPGKPDLVFGALRKVIFVHGCFWHGHDCKRGARMPKNNAAYWRTKIARNKARDMANRATLKREGWAALTIWECEIGNGLALRRKLARFLS
ncbi:MAG: very short patch repair endonuclease [Terricaulis sp.]